MTTSDEFEPRLDALIQHYLELGCPCRFPRFRAVVSRDTSGLGLELTSDCQLGLIRAFERNAPIVETQPLEGLEEVSEGMWRAMCGACGSALRRYYQEFGKGGYTEGLQVKRAPDLVELGADVERGRTYRCRPFRSPGHPQKGMIRAVRAYPFMEEDEWFEWLRELRGDEDFDSDDRA